MTTFGFILREGLSALRRPTFATFAALSTVSAMLLLATIIVVAMINVKQLLDRAALKSDVVVYVTDRTGADPLALDALAGLIRGLPQVREATVIDKGAAWERFKAMYGTAMLDAVDENPLPVSIEVSLRKECHTAAVATLLQDRLASLGSVESVRYAGEWLRFLARSRSFFLVTAIGFAAVLIVALFTVISNAVQLTIYSRKDMVRFMELAGATRLTTAMPFIVEGIFLGFAGGVIGEGAFCCIRALFAWEPSLRAIPVSWGPSPLPLLFPLIGVAFGWIGSIVAVRRFRAS